ncbi:COMM domain-containing protein 10-like isoform X2 [Ornithodoros turicata]|uniref:COMM domain-containing protein 10-like isoform X2 n=1 Tax=Ornithodoros turicata TaxID=34597 RepID=UPI003138FDDE
MTVSMFAKTASLRRAVQLINRLDDSKFGALLSRILQKLHLKDERSFSEEEEQKLQKAFSLSNDELTLVLDTLSFILEQAAFHTAKPSVLHAQLEDLELSEAKVNCIVQAWSSTAKQVIERLKRRTIAEHQLSDVNVELRVQGAQRTASHMKSPKALMDLVVSSGAAHDHLLLQFSHQQLYNLYTKLEQIQAHLDTLM